MGLFFHFGPCDTLCDWFGHKWLIEGRTSVVVTELLILQYILYSTTERRQFFCKTSSVSDKNDTLVSILHYFLKTLLVGMYNFSSKDQVAKSRPLQVTQQPKMEPNVPISQSIHCTKGILVVLK